MYNSQEFKQKLPHGFNKMVAERAGVNKDSVSRFLNGKTKSLRIEKVVLELISELAEKRISAANSLLKSDTNE